MGWTVGRAPTAPMDLRCYGQTSAEAVGKHIARWFDLERFEIVLRRL
jgi:hypothetical protein